MANPQGYDSWSSDQKNKYNRLNNEFSGQFWDPGNYYFDPGILGPNGGHIAAAYTDWIGKDPTKAFGRQEALNNMMQFFDDINSEAGQKIDATPIFDEMGRAVDKGADAALRASETGRVNALSSANRGAQGASDRATEALAGTGLGRSGVAANTFQGIETTRQNIDADIGGEADQRAAQIEAQRMEQQKMVAFERARFEMSEELHARDWDEQSIRIAEAYHQQLGAMQFEFGLNYEDDWFWDVIGPIAEIAGTAAMLL